MLVFDAILFNSKHVDAKHMAQCLVAEGRQLVMQLVCHGPVSTAPKSSIDWDCQEESPCWGFPGNEAGTTCQQLLVPVKASVNPPLSSPHNFNVQQPEKCRRFEQQ